LQMPRNASVGEVLAAFTDSASRTFQKQAAAANPFFKGIAEQMSGKNLYFDKPWNADFLRKVPTLAAIAENIGVYNYAKIPIDAIDGAAKKFLAATDNGDGTVTAEPYRFWWMTTFIPALGRMISTARPYADEDIPAAASLIRTFTGARLDYADPERTLMYDKLRALQETQTRRDVRRRLEE
jgi:hypothetical protein